MVKGSQNGGGVLWEKGSVCVCNIDSLQGLETVLKEYDETTKNDISAFKLIRDKQDELHAVRYDYSQFSYAISQALEIR